MYKYNTVTETDRLHIRPYTIHDYWNWYKEHDNRLPSQHKYDQGRVDLTLCTKQWFYDMVYKHQQLAQKDELYIYGIFRKEDGRHVGSFDFSTLLRINFQWSRFGYGIHNHFWRKGYGKEAVKTAIQIGANNLGYHRIEAHINVDNVPSINLAKKCGLMYECTRKAFILEDGKWTDNAVYYKNTIY
ncbi:MAG: GNAT family N-acetyltransferase [Bacillaceae bacterium]|nr:GNAT family N-acetyltransferase [Bacillaceae bacterium]